MGLTTKIYVLVWFWSLGHTESRSKFVFNYHGNEYGMWNWLKWQKFLNLTKIRGTKAHIQVINITYIHVHVLYILILILNLILLLLKIIFITYIWHILYKLLNKKKVISPYLTSLSYYLDFGNCNPHYLVPNCSAINLESMDGNHKRFTQLFTLLE